LLTICSNIKYTEAACSSGAIDAFNFIVLHPAFDEGSNHQHQQKMQHLSLTALTLCVKKNPSCFEDIHTSGILLHVLNNLITFATSDRYITSGLGLLAACMKQQPLVCKLLHDHGLLTYILPHLQTTYQLPALRCLNYLLVCSYTSNHDLATQVLLTLRTSGALINLSWLLHHENSVIVASAQDILNLLVKMHTDREMQLAQDLMEQGCLLLLYKNHHPIWSWLLHQVDLDCISLLLNGLARSTNTLLRTNIILSLLCVASADVNKARYLITEDFVGVMQISLHEPVIRHRVMSLFLILCNPNILEERNATSKPSDVQVFSRENNMSLLIPGSVLKYPLPESIEFPSLGSTSMSCLAQYVHQNTLPDMTSLTSQAVLEIASLAQTLGLTSLLHATVKLLAVQVQRDCSYLWPMALQWRVLSVILMLVRQDLKSSQETAQGNANAAANVAQTITMLLHDISESSCVA
jgi:hypothetical protein